MKRITNNYLLGGITPHLAARQSIDRIAKKYPNFSGAVVAASKFLILSELFSIFLAIELAKKWCKYNALFRQTIYVFQDRNFI